MKSQNIEKVIKDFCATAKTDVKTTADMDARIINDATAAHQITKKKRSAELELNIWRTIMKNPMTKFATAAAVVLIVLLGITLLDKSATPAYAIEQTIEAMRSINSIHAYCTDWDDSQGQTWVQVNPETDKEEYYHADQGNLLIVGTPQATYYYYKDENLVRIRNEYVPASDVRFSHFFEDMVSWVGQYHGEISFHSRFEDDLQQEVIVVHGSIPAQKNMGEKEFVVRVDPQTKLPIDLEMLKCRAGEGVKSVDHLEYNVAIPEGIFEFDIPDGAKVIYDE